MIELAVEIGNTNTTIFKYGYGIVLREPTLVAVEEKDGLFTVKAFGEDALLLQGKTDESITIFSPVSLNKIISPEYAELFLKYLLKKVFNFEESSKKISITFCIPVSFDSENRNILEKIAVNLNCADFRFAPSCVLAVLGIRNDVNDASPVMVADLGGGKCDLAVVRGLEIEKGISIFMGGKNLDDSIMKFLEEQFSIQIGTLVAKEIKDEISSLFANNISHIQVVGKSITNNEPKKIDLTANDILSIVEEFFDKVSNSIALFVSSCQVDTIAEISKNGVYIIGGLSNISNLKNYLMNKQKNLVFIPENNDSLIMDGAKIAIKNPKILDKICASF
ncbi:MAG: rod shape-determining protein [Clostridia bacterium]